MPFAFQEDRPALQSELDVSCPSQEREIENEKGHLVWSVDITTPGTKDITEIWLEPEVRISVNRVRQRRPDLVAA